jgi:hypothetical protein
MAAAAVASLVLLVLSVLAMARRVDDYYRETDHRLYVFNRVDERQFSYAGRPVTITDQRTASGEEGVVVRYGDESLPLRATIEPGSAQLPGLERHNDWMQILRFAEHGRTSLAEVEQGVRLGEIADHLVIVVRIPIGRREGANEAQRKAWHFDFYEFKPDGGFAHQRLGFPKKRTPAEGEMAEGTWQYYAALMVMPPLWKPTQKFSSDALQATGWTLPVAALSGLLFTASGVALLAPRKRTPLPAPAH